MVNTLLAKHAMPVLHIDTGRTWGGGQQQVISLHQALLRKGMPSLLVCHRGSPLAQKAAVETATVFELNLNSPIRVAAAVEVARVCRKQGVRTIHMYTSPAHSIGLLAERRLTNDVHKVVSRLVAFPKKPHPLRRRKYVGRNIRYLAVSEAVKGTLLELGIPEEDISIVHPGIEVEKYSHFDQEKARAIAVELRIAPDRFVVGSVGSLVGCKGHDVLIEAFARAMKAIPKGVCILVGEGPRRSHLESLIRRKGLGEKVKLVGQWNEVPELLSLMDVFVMPSLQEAFGLAVVEAMAAGKPVLASDVGGIPEIIRNGEDGLLVPANDPDALAQALVGLSSDGARMERLASNARKRASEQFSLEVMVQSTLEMYGSLA